MTKARDLANASTALSAVSATELGYLDGVTSAVQTQMDAKLASSTAATTYVANSLADAKGDLFVATADNTVTRLPVGSTGDTIVADSSTATGLRWQGNYAAGKNKIINGDFGIWQRGTTFNSASSNTYFADRFTCYVGGGTHNITRQTFTPGTAPVAGYEGQYFLRWTSTVGGAVALSQRIENVQTFAGQTVTLSFWAKADSAINISTALYQVFGSGGSSVVTNTSGNQAITTSWARYSFVFNLASIAGKTIGTNSNLQVDINLPNSTFVFDTWGWQLEAGSVATAFQTATGTIQGELAACQRYYWRQTPGNSGVISTFGTAKSTTATVFSIMPPTTMRITPASVDYSSLVLYDGVTGQIVSTITLGGTFGMTGQIISFDANTAGTLVQYRPYFMYTNSATGYFGLSAEL